MTQAAPQTIFNDLMERAVAVLQGRRMSDIELRRFEKEIASLERADLAGMYELRGFVAEMKGDADEMNAMYRRALGLTKDYVGAVVRYLMLLSGAARTDDLIEAYRQYGDALRGDIGALRAAEGALLFGGWCETAAHLTNQLERMGADPFQGVGLYPVAVDRGELAEADVAHTVGFVHRFLISRGYRAQTVQAVRIPAENGSSHVLVQMQLNESPARVAELEWDLFEQMDKADLPAEQQGFVRVALSSRQADLHAHYA